VDGLVCDQALTGYDGAIDEPSAAARTGTGRSIRARASILLVQAFAAP
jgi:hypothetical protein